MQNIYVDADACPVKDEVYRVAKRHDKQVILVSNARMRIPSEGKVRLEVVNDAFDAADDWIVEQAGQGDIVVTSDIPLADRCLKKGAYVLGNNGDPFTANNIGNAMAARELFSELRQMGEMRGGPPPFTQKTRSQFLQRLDQAIRTLQRQHLKTPGSGAPSNPPGPENPQGESQA